MPRRLIVLTPSIAVAPHSSLVYMFDTIRRRLGADESVFVGEASPQQGWTIDFRRAIVALEEAVKRPAPVLLLGTAFSYVHLLDYLETHERKFELPRNSVALETGGYKGRSRELSKRDLHLAIEDRLGILPRC